MTGANRTHLGELRFRTTDGCTAVVVVYRGKGTFTLVRLPGDERSNIDVYDGEIEDYISEATLEWPDLQREGVEVLERR